jgi:hypothetical protein
MKVDKEFLIKHRFWILIGLFVILALVPLFLLTTSVSATVAAATEGYTKAKKAVEGISGSVPNTRFVDAYTIKDKFVADKKAVLHKEAWDAQKSMLTYPESLTPVVKDMYVGDAIDFHNLDKFAREYKNQLSDAVIEIKPLIPQEGFENGVVQFAGNSINGVLNLAVSFDNLPPTKEDFWLAQEDLWVKRELLRVIRDANELVARFHAADEEKPAPQKKPEQPKPADAAAAAEAKPAEGAAPAAAEKPAPKPVVAKKPIDYNHRVFRNQHWELDLTLKPGQNDKKQPVYLVGGTIKNIGKRRRPLGVVFKVLMQPGADAAGIALPVDREPLGVEETWQIPPKEFTPQQVAFEGLYGVEELLTWRTAPVKRIDVIALDYSSSRMANRTLKPPRWYTPPVEETAPGADGAPGGPPIGGAMANKMKEMGMGGDGPAGPGGMGAMGSPVTKNGMILNRYIDTNEQVRHMPVGMVVIADDEHLSELLSAFSNSRLRIQVTQCHWQVCRDKMAPLSPDSAPTAPGVPGRIAAGAAGGKMMGGMRGGKGGDDDGGRINQMFRGARGPGGPGGAGGKMSFPGGGMIMPGGPPGNMGGLMSRLGVGLGGPGGVRGQFGGISDDDEEENLNLLEVAVYGVASLYERFPPKPPAPEGATAEGTPGAAPGTAPATSPAPGQVGIAK